MSDDFAFRWAYTWMAAMILLAVTGIASRLPLPSSPSVCLFIGGIYGAAMIGPIVYVALRRR
jgi:hypothetical protein